MNPWLVGFLVYWLVSVVANTTFLVVCSWVCEQYRSEDDEEASIWEQVRTPFQGLSLARRCVAILLVLLATPIVFPFVAYCILKTIAESWRDIRELNRVQRSHRPYVCRPIHPANLHRDVEEHFDERTTEFVNLDFETIGTYQLKDDPVGMKGRCFRGLDGVAFASVISMESQFGFSFVSIFQDGFVLETAAEEGDFLLEYNNSETFTVVLTGRSASVAETLEAHLQAITERLDCSTVPVLAFQATQLRDIQNYEGRIYSKLGFEHGDKDHFPPEAVLPEGRPVYHLRVPDLEVIK